MVWRLVLAIAAALAARPDPPRGGGVDPATVRRGGVRGEAVPVLLDTAPRVAPPDPGAPATLESRKQEAHWEW